MSLASFLFNMLGEEKKCMDFGSIRIYLERNKQMSKVTEVTAVYLLH